MDKLKKDLQIKISHYGPFAFAWTGPYKESFTASGGHLVVNE